MTSQDDAPGQPVKPTEPAPSAGPASPPAEPHPEAGPATSPRRRRILLWLGPIVAVLVAAWFYFTGGRYVSETDANTGAASVLIAPEVAGKIVSRPVVEGQIVKAGDVLFTVDPTPYRIARDAAAAQLAQARQQIASLTAAYELKLSAIKQNEATLAYAQVTYDRMEDLEERKVGTVASRDQALANLNVAKATVAQAQADAQSALAQIGGSTARPVDEQPSVQSALLTLRNAQRNLDLTEVKAPFDGKLTNVDSVAIGSEMAVGTTAMALVAVRSPWIVANIKETSLPGIVPGRPVKVTIDAFPDQVWDGTVTVVGSATGESFAILPAQNTTGNWVKVVQRVPVRITLKPIQDVPEISTGLSATVEIDTGRRRSLGTLFHDLGSLVGVK